MRKKYYRELRPSDIGVKRSARLLNSSVLLPSQHQAYNLCVEFARDWFLEKFNKDFFTNVYIDGKMAFDEFRKFSIIDDKLVRENPLLAITPEINIEHNRDWVDTAPEMPLNMRRSRMDGTFFNDNERHIHALLAFKTILMNFTFRIRLDTRAEQLDMIEFIKLNHRAGFTESKYMDMDIHVPKQLIAQIAIDAGFEVDENYDIKNPVAMLNYLNSHSYIPFIYKLRCANGNKEFFLKVPNCYVHLKTDMPSKDDGERSGVVTRNYNIEVQTEIEMTAPLLYTYYSEFKYKHVLTDKCCKDGMISVMKSVVTEIPEKNCNGWDLYTKVEYMNDEIDLNTCITIDFKEFFEGSDLNQIINYTKDCFINPAVFMDFRLFNNGVSIPYAIDWVTLKCTTQVPIKNQITVIAIYVDKNYINDSIININNNEDERITVTE